MSTKRRPYEDAIARMTDHEFREEFSDLLAEVRRPGQIDPVYVAIEVEDGELNYGWGRSKFTAANLTFQPDPFMSYDRLRHRLVGV